MDIFGLRLVTDCKRWSDVHDIVTKDEKGERKVYCDFFISGANGCRIVSSERGCEVYNRHTPGDKLELKQVGIGEKIKRILKHEKGFTN